MTTFPAPITAVSRRRLLALAASATAIPHMGFAQAAAPQATAPAAPPEAPAAPQQFSFDLLAEEMRVLATRPHQPAAKPEGFLGNLNYDEYRLIRFNDAKWRWNEPGSAFRLAAFGLGAHGVEIDEPGFEQRLRDGFQGGVGFAQQGDAIVEGAQNTNNSILNN